MDDIEEIKRLVSRRPVIEEIEESPTLPENIVSLEKKIEHTPKHAPLFVKIDKYREILENLQEMKATLTHLRKLSILRRDIEKLQTSYDDIISKIFERLGGTTEKLDMEFVIPQAMRPFIKDIETESMDSFVHELDSEITKLRTELEHISF